MSFATLGYEVRPLFSAAEIGLLQQCVADHMQRVAGAMLKPQAEAEPDAPFDERIERIAAQDHSFAQLLATAVCTDAQRAATAQELAHDPRLTGMAADLAGCAIGDRLWRFRLNSPSLPASRQPWHSDVVRVTGPCSDVAITAWIPLGDIVGADAGLEIAAGRRDAPLPHEAVAGVTRRCRMRRWPAGSPLRRIIWPMVLSIIHRFRPGMACSSIPSPRSVMRRLSDRAAAGAWWCG